MSEKPHSQSAALLTPKNLFEAMKDSDSKIRENQEETINGAEDDNNGLDTSNPQQNDDDDCKLFVGGLAQEATEKDITEYFGKFGKVVSVNLIMDQITGCSRGIAWVVFQHVDILSKVLAELHVIKGKKVAVKKVKRKTYKISCVKTNPEVQKRLFDAICEGNLKKVEFFLKHITHVANINALDKTGRSPLFIAAKHGRFEIVKFLLQCGADIHAKSNSGQSVLYIAAYSGSVEIVKLFHQEGVDINAKDNKGWSPLHCAAYHGHLAVVKYLIENRAWLNPKDQKNETPLDIAFNYCKDDIVNYLKTALEKQEALKRKNLSPKCSKEEIESKKQEALLRKNWLQKRRRTQ